MCRAGIGLQGIEQIEMYYLPTEPSFLFAFLGMSQDALGYKGPVPQTGRKKWLQNPGISFSS